MGTCFHSDAALFPYYFGQTCVIIVVSVKSSSGGFVVDSIARVYVVDEYAVREAVESLS